MELLAPSHWRSVDLLSDLHLHTADRPTFERWTDYMQSTPADAVLLLGDLFEVWVGDDAIIPGSFEAECVAVLRAVGARKALYIMQGNRDFLMGPTLMQACSATALPDPTVLTFGAKRWLLSHGDALCVDDVEYQTFRKQVRSPEWQSQFLSKSLPERQAIAKHIREASQSRKQDGAYADVDTGSALQWLQAARSDHLIHGHTHLPAEHLLDAMHQRTVLSDWDMQARVPRAEVLRLSLDKPQPQRIRLAPQATADIPG